MQKTIEHTVGDTTYQITTFPALKGLSILQRLLTIIGPSISEIVGSAEINAESKLEDFVVDGDVFGKALGMFIENMDKADAAKLMREMVDSSVTVDGQKLPFDQHFSHNYGHLISVIVAIVRENYQSFFDGSGFGGLESLLPTRPDSNSE